MKYFFISRSATRSTLIKISKKGMVFHMADLTSFGNNSTFSYKGGLRHLLEEDRKHPPYEPPDERITFRHIGGKPCPVPSAGCGKGPVKRIKKNK